MTNAKYTRTGAHNNRGADPGTLAECPVNFLSPVCVSVAELAGSRSVGIIFGVPEGGLELPSW